MLGQGAPALSLITLEKFSSDSKCPYCIATITPNIRYLSRNIVAIAHNAHVHGDIY